MASQRCCIRVEREIEVEDLYGIHYCQHDRGHEEAK